MSLPLSQYEILREWDRLRPLVAPHLSVDVPEGSTLLFKWDRAKSRMAALGNHFSNPELRVSRAAAPPELTHDFTILLIHEMCHLPDVENAFLGEPIIAHRAPWKKAFRAALDAAGYTAHPVTTVYVPYVQSDHPHMPIRLEHATADIPRSGWMYYCDCPEHDESAGGYGIRSRRSLDGRICKHCNSLHVIWVDK